MPSVDLIRGDCRDAMLRLSVGPLFDSVVTDPPYGLVSTVKRFGKPGSAPAKSDGATGVYARASKGFMGKEWDGTGVETDPVTWALAWDCLKPGGHLIAFGGTRTFHRIAVAIEDAGFEIRDTLMFLYGTGFPKSHNLDNSDAFCRCATRNRGVRGMRDFQNDAGGVVPQDSAPDVLAPVQRGVARAGVGEARTQGPSGPENALPAEIRADKSGLERRGDASEATRELRSGSVCEVPAGSAPDGAARRLCDGTPTRNGAVGSASVDPARVCPPQGPQPSAQRARKSGTMAGQPQSQDGGIWPLCNGCGKPRIPSGLGTSLKPAFEPIILARKPLVGTVAGNVLAHGVGALNIDACRVPTDETIRTSRNIALGSSGSGVYGTANVPGVFEGHDAGRWPANVLHDGSAEVLDAFAAFAAYGERGASAPVFGTEPSAASTGRVTGQRSRVPGVFHGDSGSAARFFYSAKASAADRAGSRHPTIKPIALMRWLVQLVTPPGGRVLDPFAGSGTTLQAAYELGCSAIGCEADPEYQSDIERRISRMTDELEGCLA